MNNIELNDQEMKVVYHNLIINFYDQFKFVGKEEDREFAENLLNKFKK